MNDIRLLVYQNTHDLIKANVVNTMNMARGFFKCGCKVHYFISSKKYRGFFSDKIEAEFVYRDGHHATLQYVKDNDISVVYCRDRNFVDYLLKSDYGGKILLEDHDENLPDFIELARSKDNFVLITISPVITNKYNVRYSVTFPCAIDVEMFSDNDTEDVFSRDKINVTYCGHLYDYKGIPFIINGMKRFPDVQFHFVGGKDRDIERNKKRCEELDNVTFWGHQPYNKVSKFLHSSDVLLIPYDRRGNIWSKSYITSPIKLFEYLATKKSVLCSDIKGIRTWVNNDDVTFYKANNIDSYCEKLRYIIDNIKSDEFTAKSEHGYNTAVKYSIENRCRSTLDKIVEMEKVEKRCIVVTGCAGFIGSHTCEKLLKDGYDVVGIDNLNDYYDVEIKKRNVKLLEEHPNFTFYKEDIRDTDIISRVTPFKVCHLASTAGVRYSIQNPKLYVDVNINGFINILEECIKNNVKHLVYASSSSVYGLNKKLPFSEDDPINTCNSPYATSKMAMEMYAKTYNQLYGLRSIGLRFFTVYGPRGRPDMAPYKFLTAIMNDTKFHKYGDGETSRDYTYIDDIVSGVVAALDNKNNMECDVFNLGNSNPITLNEFIATCEKVVGKKAIYEQIENQLGDVPHTFADISKAEKLLNYNPKTDLVTGLGEMYKSLM